VLHCGICNLKILVHLMATDIIAGEVEEGILLQQSIFHAVGLNGGDLDIGRDAATTIDGTAAIGELDFLIIRGGFFAFTVVVIVVKGNAGVLTLNQTSAGSVIFRSSKGQG